jgi:hypothetical protein
MVETGVEAPDAEVENWRIVPVVVAVLVAFATEPEAGGGVFWMT